MQHLMLNSPPQFWENIGDKIATLSYLKIATSCPKNQKRSGVDLSTRY